MSLLPFATEIIYNDNNRKKIKHTHANKRDGAPHKIKRRQRLKTTAQTTTHAEQISHMHETDRELSTRERHRAMRTYT